MARPQSRSLIGWIVAVVLVGAPAVLMTFANGAWAQLTPLACNTIIKGSGNDVVNGTSGCDYIDVDGGNDVVYGLVRT